MEVACIEVKVKGGVRRTNQTKVAESCFHRSIGIDKSIPILDSRKIALGLLEQFNHQ